MNLFEVAEVVVEVAKELTDYGVDVIGIEIRNDPGGSRIQVRKPQDIHRAAQILSFPIGPPYGSYEHPIVSAIGFVRNVELNIYGPLR